MTLGKELDARRATAKDRFPPEDLAIMRRATEDLRSSGILQRALKPGDAAPDWSLSAADGRLLHSRELLVRGPLIITFFRGIW